MTIRQMIAEWRKGCTCGGPRAIEGRKDHPADCAECTEALIDCIEKHAASEELSTTLLHRLGVHLALVSKQVDSGIRCEMCENWHSRHMRCAQETMYAYEMQGGAGCPMFKIGSKT